MSSLQSIVRKSTRFYQQSRSKKSYQKILQLFNMMIASYDKGLAETVGGESDTFAIDMTEKKVDSLFEDDHLAQVLALPPKPVDCGMIIVIFFRDGIVFISQELHQRTICRFTDDPNRFENLTEKI